MIRNKMVRTGLRNLSEFAASVATKADAKLDERVETAMADVLASDERLNLMLGMLTEKAEVGFPLIVAPILNGDLVVVSWCIGAPTKKVRVMEFATYRDLFNTLLNVALGGEDNGLVSVLKTIA